ncbi:hypothetical protein [Mycobacterium sp. 1274756.6]|uniref:hypothetical protein n=1 Tax=Mycobacterium sp. 1274756.6 TaxID=1834076 RepID=UPI0007FDAAF3|nr:hypothetical protein [Mycobacterium sp. 1274756.6]OBJ72007.1 hypothetical protein A5643_06390 [Mycobacterium sp. 1274756.6]
MASLTDRLVAALGEVLAVDAESDGALTVRYDGTVASLRVVPITEGLELVSLTQIVGWDLPLNKKLRDTVAGHAERAVLGAPAVVEKPAEAAGGRRNTGKTADVMLRYNFPGSGLADDALATMVLLVLDKGVEIRQDLQG